jgi:hypothetical protein
MDSLSIDLSKCRFFDDGNGYLCFYMPKHPLARQNGTVALQRHILSVHLGRWLDDNEMIWFINKDRHDVRVENLQLVTQKEFLELFAPDGNPIELTCKLCGKPFTVVESQVHRRWHCSRKCQAEASRRFEIDPKELEKLVWEMPTVHVATLLGVSDKAIEKRCKKYGIRKPPRGYWRKIETGHWEEEDVERPYQPGNSPAIRG